MAIGSVRRLVVGVALILGVVSGQLVLGLVTQPATAAAHYRLLITGDSITQGSSGDYTWRYRLWDKLNGTAPGAVTFVGTRTDLFDNVANKQGSPYYAVPFAGKAHSALWGDTYQAELGAIGSQVAATQPDVLVVMLGSNDLAYLTSPEQTIANLKTYIARARAAAPGLDIVVGEVLDKWDPWAGQYQLRSQVADYASRLKALAASLDTASQRVVVAATRDGWDSRIHSWDGTHPNPTGEALIAQRVSQALAKIGVGTTGPDISGPKAWSVAGPTPVLKAGTEKADLSWDRVPSGATGMFIEQRLTNINEPWLRLPYSVGGDGWTAEQLAGLGTYDFRLVPSKGFNTGLPGAYARVTVGGLAPGDIYSVTPRAAGPSPHGGQKAAATWTPSENAQGYLLSLRLMREDQNSWDDLPYPVSQRSWTFEPLIEGRRYEFRVRGSRGFANGRWRASDTVRMNGIPGTFAHAALGDSYSSGLGSSGDYTGGDCMRADRAWTNSVYQVKRGPSKHLACAGATIPGVRGQLGAMDDFFATYPSRPQLVTLTVGGNDVGFRDLLEECVSHDCESRESDVHTRIQHLQYELEDLYKDIRGRHPYADILVGGYPDVVERYGNSWNPLCVRLDDPEREMIRRLVNHLNIAMAGTADGAGVWSVGQRLQTTFSGHNACSSSEWIHAGNLDFGGEKGLIDKKSFHPNDGGQYHYTEVFNQLWEEETQ